MTHLTFDEGRECLSSRAPAGDLQTGRHRDDLVTLAGRGAEGVGVEMGMGFRTGTGEGGGEGDLGL